jgi:hypothetical protein
MTAENKLAGEKKTNTLVLICVNHSNTLFSCKMSFVIFYFISKQIALHYYVICTGSRRELCITLDSLGLCSDARLLLTL